MTWIRDKRLKKAHALKACLHSLALFRKIMEILGGEACLQEVDSLGVPLEATSCSTHVSASFSASFLC